MAAGDFVVRRNNANTDALPVAGSTLDLLWDTAVDNEGTGITYSAGTFTLGETGRFLVMFSDQWGTTDTTANERTNARTSLILAGTRLNEGSVSGYVRRTSGSQEYINSGICYVNVSTTTGNGDDLKVQHERVDNSTAGTVNRIADRSGVSIYKLDDSWKFAHYRSSAAYTPSATDHTRNQSNIGTTVEQDGTVFARTGNVVTVTTANPVLVMYTHYNDLGDVLTGRTEMQGSIDFDSVELVRGVSQAYGPTGSDNADYGIMSSATIIYPDNTGQPLEFNLISREDADEDWFTEVQMFELPSTVETATVQRTTAAGDVNAAGTDFAFESVVNVDAVAFTHTAGNANIDVDNAGDYLALANVGTLADGGVSGTRAVPAQSFRVNTTDQAHVGGSTYNRAVGTANHAHIFTGTILPGLAANDTVQVRHARIGTATASAPSTGGFTLVRLSSLLSGGVSGTIGLATETDLAQPVSAEKPYAVGLATETDLAQGVTRGVAIGQASETDTARQAFAKLTSPWTTPVEVTTFAGVDIVTETDTALTLIAVQTRAVGQATETDTALDTVFPQFVTIGLATETDTAIALTFSGPSLVITSRALYRFYRIDGQLVMSPVGTGVNVGFKSAENYEQVSDIIRVDQDKASAAHWEQAMLAVAAAWAANSGASAATLQTALHAALQAAGWRHPDGTDLP